MPVNVVKTDRDEHLWDKAKERAKEQGKSEDWAYVMGIFKKMKGEASTRHLVIALKIIAQSMRDFETPVTFDVPEKAVDLRESYYLEYARDLLERLNTIYNSLENTDRMGAYNAVTRTLGEINAYSKPFADFLQQHGLFLMGINTLLTQVEDTLADAQDSNMNFSPTLYHLIEPIYNLSRLVGDPAPKSIEDAVNEDEDLRESLDAVMERSY